jgi:integrase
MGMVYKRGKTYWLKWYDHGRAKYESAKTDKRSDALRLLKEREGRVARGEPTLNRADQVRFEEISADLRQHYQVTGCRKLADAEDRLAHLNRYFRGRRVATIGPSEIETFVAHRKAQHARAGTINRDLEVLGKMFRLAYENNKVFRPPIIHKLKEAPPRQGFVERDQFEAICRYLSPDLQVVVTIMFTYGWRVRSEVLTLQRRQVDLEVGTLRLEPGSTKNGEGRLVYLTPELKRLLTAQMERVRSLDIQTGRISPHVFPHLSGRFKGRRIGNFRGAWAKACELAGCPGILRHDMRRSAVRSLVNAGVPERVAMRVTGHKTRSVFDRYHIVSPADLQEAARRLSAATLVTNTVTIPQIPLDAPLVNQYGS